MKDNPIQCNMWILESLKIKAQKEAKKQRMPFGRYVENLIKKDLEK